MQTTVIRHDLIRTGGKGFQHVAILAGKRSEHSLTRCASPNGKRALQEERVAAVVESHKQMTESSVGL